MNYQRRDDAGHVTWHQMAFADTGEGFILAYHDIDAIMREEQKKQEELRRALRSAEAANQEKDAIHRALGSGDWSMRFDEHGQMVSCTWSQRFREMLGYTSPDDFPDVLESWSDLLHPEDKERVLNHYWDVVNDYTGQKTYDVYYRLATLNRGERWFRAIGRLTRRADGSPVTFYGIFLDVDDDRRSNLKHEAETTDLINALSSVYIDVILVDMAKGTSKPVKMDTAAQRMGDGFFAVKDRPYSMAEYVDGYVHPEDRSGFEQVRTIEACRSFFADRDSYSCNYRSQRDDEIHYMQIQMVRPDADGDELVLGFRNMDAQEAERLERTRQEHELLGVVEALSSEYKAVYVINAKTHVFRVIHENTVGHHLSLLNEDAEAALRSYVDAYVAEEDRERMHRACLIHTMEEEVPEEGILYTNFRRVGPQGMLHYQMNIAKFVAEDGSRYFVLGFRDNTPAVEKEL